MWLTIGFLATLSAASPGPATDPSQASCLRTITLPAAYAHLLEAWQHEDDTPASDAVRPAVKGTASSVRLTVALPSAACSPGRKSPAGSRPWHTLTPGATPPPPGPDQPSAHPPVRWSVMRMSDMDPGSRSAVRDTVSTWLSTWRDRFRHRPSWLNTFTWPTERPSTALPHPATAFADRSHRGEPAPADRSPAAKWLAPTLSGLVEAQPEGLPRVVRPSTVRPDSGRPSTVGPGSGRPSKDRTRPGPPPSDGTRPGTPPSRSKATPKKRPSDHSPGRKRTTRTRGDLAATAAVARLGTPFSWGGGNPAGPSRGIGRGAGTVGFDCSGLTLYAWSRAGVKLGHYTGTQFRQGKRVRLSDLRRGDLVFFGGGTGDPTHVGLYLGNGIMIHAPKTGDVVKKTDFLDSTYYRPRYRGAVRPG
ncbi:NlpC/P60 family protein [Nonomuraea dietziae]|uniref:NlpC/P60 family protein n=1 Tax=Nonomuraea dietziae TaxID=65515 RepID=UPI00340C827A